MPIAPSSLSKARQRSLLLEYRFRVDSRNIDQLCKKYDIKPRDFQHLRKEQDAPFATEEELVIAGVYGGGHTIQLLISYLDYRNHAGYRPEEVRAFLKNLESIGILAEDAGEWRFVPGSPAAEGRFIFTAPQDAAHQPVYFGEQRHAHGRSGA